MFGRSKKINCLTKDWVVIENPVKHLKVEFFANIDNGESW